MDKLTKYFRRHPYRVAFLVGFIYYGYAISWMFGLRTSQLAAGLSGYFVAISAAFIMTASFAIGPLVLIWLASKLNLRFKSAFDLVWLTTAWVSVEYGRAFLFSIVSYGPGGKLGPYWVFGNLGLWLVHTPLVYASRIGGLYLLSGLMFGLIVSFIWIIKKGRWLPFGITCFIAVVLSAIGWSAYRMPSGPNRQVAALQFAPESEPNKSVIKSRDLLNNLNQSSLDLIVLPEYSRFWETDPDQDSRAIQRVLKFDNGQITGLVIDSVQDRSASVGLNLISFHDGSGRRLYEQGKWFIVPGGEFIPYLYQVILVSAGRTELLDNFAMQKSVQPSQHPEIPYKFDGVTYGALSCSGILAPDLYRDLTQRGAEVLTSSASLDTLGIAEKYHAEARDLAILHAVANARPFIQSARGGRSYIIDSNGRFVDQTLAAGYGLIEGKIAANSRRTIYTAVGDWPVAIALLLLGARLYGSVGSKLFNRTTKVRSKLV